MRPNPSINTDAGEKAAGAGYVKRYNLGLHMEKVPLFIFGALFVIAFIYFYALYLRPEYLKNKFISMATEYAPREKSEVIFEPSPFMKKDYGSITECKLKNIIFYQSFQVAVLSNIWYVVIHKKTSLVNGIYGSGYVKNSILDPRTFEDMKKLFKSEPISKVKASLGLSSSPECIEIFNGNAYIYYKCGSIFGSSAIELGFQNV